MDCDTDILVDVSVPQTSAHRYQRKAAYTGLTPYRVAFGLDTVTACPPLHAIEDYHCETGMLVNINEDDGSLTARSEIEAKSNDRNLNCMSESLLEEEEFNFSHCDSMCATPARPHRAIHSTASRPSCDYLGLSLTAHQRAEIFEQANTVATRIGLAGRKLAGPADAETVEQDPERNPDRLTPPSAGRSIVNTSTPVGDSVPSIEACMSGGGNGKAQGGVKLGEGGGQFLKPPAVSGGARGAKLTLQRRSIAEKDLTETKPKEGSTLRRSASSAQVPSLAALRGPLASSRGSLAPPRSFLAPVRGLAPLHGPLVPPSVPGGAAKKRTLSVCSMSSISSVTSDTSATNTNDSSTSTGSGVSAPGKQPGTLARLKPVARGPKPPPQLATKAASAITGTVRKPAAPVAKTVPVATKSKVAKVDAVVAKGKMTEGEKGAKAFGGKKF